MYQSCWDDILKSQPETLFDELRQKHLCLHVSSTPTFLRYYDGEESVLDVREDECRKPRVSYYDPIVRVWLTFVPHEDTVSHSGVQIWSEPRVLRYTSRLEHRYFDNVERPHREYVGKPSILVCHLDGEEYYGMCRSTITHVGGALTLTSWRKEYHFPDGTITIEEETGGFGRGSFLKMLPDGSRVEQTGDREGLKYIRPDGMIIEFDKCSGCAKAVTWPDGSVEGFYSHNSIVRRVRSPEGSITAYYGHHMRHSTESPDGSVVYFDPFTGEECGPERELSTLLKQLGTFEPETSYQHNRDGSAWV